MKRLGKLKTLTIASLSVVALAGSAALAQTASTTQDSQQVQRGEGRGHRSWGNKEGRGWRGERGERGGRMHGMMFRDLNLSDDQKAKMKQIGQSFREGTKSLREQLHAKRQELRQASEGGTFNEALATQKLQESAGLQAKLMGEQFKMRQEMLSVLTPEQKTQLEQKRAEFKAKRANHGERKPR
ncbi:MAG TPA: Spy/CpxP family protein refolding chaperone [Pyrinomonadaceae bacterium]|nr:Spy/CpxP family protein refolding chaperone [Pyrinomonadaceae bacterium]